MIESNVATVGRTLFRDGLLRRNRYLMDHRSAKFSGISDRHCRRIVMPLLRPEIIRPGIQCCSLRYSPILTKFDAYDPELIAQR